MDEFLTHTLSIEDHPICAYKVNFKMQYVMGLGEFMCYMSSKDERARLVFDAWSRCIAVVPPELCWRYTVKCRQIKKAVAVKLRGLRFFTMRWAFFFDCFYLVSKLNPQLLPDAYDFLRKHLHGNRKKKVLSYLYTYWNRPILRHVPVQLMDHRTTDWDFQGKPLKKVLVVATMSAGKSTLINALTGFRVNEMKTTACTNKICYLYNKPIPDGIVVKDTNGHYSYNCDEESARKESFDEAAFCFNSMLSRGRFCLIDTPGSNYSEDSHHGEMTRNMIDSNDYDAILFVVNALDFNSTDEASLREYVFSHTTKPVIFVLNKLDGFNPDDDSIQNTMVSLSALVDRQDRMTRVVPLSAYYALLLKVGAERLTRQEQIQMERLKGLFQYDYYHLPKYLASDGNDQVSEGGEIAKTGIAALENIIINI